MVRLNLIPEHLLAAQIRRKRIRRWSAAVLVSVASMALPLVADGFQYNRIRALRTESTRLFDELQRVQADLQAVTVEAGAAQVHLEHADALRTKRAWSGILELLASQLPETCWLTSLATDPAVPTGGQSSPKAPTPSAENKAAAPQPTVIMMEAPRKLKITGYAPDSALPHALAQSLKGTNVFSQVSLLRSVREPTADGPFYRFELECEW